MDKISASKVLECYYQGGLPFVFNRSMFFLLNSIELLTNNWMKRLDESSRAYHLSAKDKAILSRNKVFSDCHKGERCFIIGNGPSLNSQNLSLLAHELTFVMSGFWKHSIVNQWQPKYYFFADPIFFDESEPVNKFFADLSSCIHSTTFFVPLAAREAIQRKSLLPLDQTHFVAFQGGLGKDGLSNRPDLTRSIPSVINVSELAIMTAIYMGCSPIYLLGLDHDWLAHRSLDTHFYQSKTIDNHPEAHGDLSRISYKANLECVLDLWNGYEALLKNTQQHEIAIFNATEEGFLDIFKRINYDSLFPPTLPQ